MPTTTSAMGAAMGAPVVLPACSLEHDPLREHPTDTAHRVDDPNNLGRPGAPRRDA